MAKKNKQIKDDPSIIFIITSTDCIVTDKTIDKILKEILSSVISDTLEIPAGFVFIPSDGGAIRVSTTPPNLVNGNFFNWIIVMENYGQLCSPKIWNDGHYSYVTSQKEEVSLPVEEVEKVKAILIKGSIPITRLFHKVSGSQRKALKGIVDLAFEKTKEILDFRNSLDYYISMGTLSNSTYLTSVLEEVLHEDTKKSKELLNSFLVNSQSFNVKQELQKDDVNLTDNVMFATKKFLN